MVPVRHPFRVAVLGDAHEPTEQNVDPTVAGINTVLGATRTAGVSRVVVTSSTRTITPQRPATDPSWQAVH